MKKIIIFILFTLSGVVFTDAFSDENSDKCSEVVNNSRYVEFFSSLNFGIPKSASQKDDFSLTTASLIYGAHLVLKPVDLRFYQKTQNLSFGKIGSWNSGSDFFSILKDPAWSIKISGPLSFYFGTLNFSQAVSRLKKPSLYTGISAFSTFCNFTSGLGIYGATKSASERPFATAVSYKDSHLCIEGAVTQNANTAISASCKTQVLPFFKADFLACFMTFDLEPKTDSSWRSGTPSFTGGRKKGVYIEGIFSVPLFTSKIAGGALENPFNTVRLFGTADALFHYGVFSCGAQVFVTDRTFTSGIFERASGNKTITGTAQESALEDSVAPGGAPQGTLYGTPFLSAAGSVEKTIFQAKVNPVFTFHTKNTKNKITVKIGVTAFYDFSEIKTGARPEFEDSLSVAAGLKISSAKNSLYTFYKMQDTKHSLFAYYSHYAKNFTISCNAKVLAEVLDSKAESPFFCNMTESFSIGISPKNFPLTRAALSAEFEQKPSGSSAAFTGALSYGFNLKYVRFTGKIQLKAWVVM